MANLGPEAEGIDMTVPLIENPARDMEIFPEYSDAADRYVRRLYGNFRFTIQGFILSTMDLLFEEKNLKKAPSLLSQSFTDWRSSSLEELGRLPTENNNRLAYQIGTCNLEDVYNGVIIGLDEVLDLAVRMEDRLYGRKKVETTQRWKRFSHIARIAAAVENRNVD